MPGPIAKRVEERRRKNVVPGETLATMHGTVPVPETPTGVHPAAAEWYEAVKISGQALFFEPTDWAAALVTCYAITDALGPNGSAAKMTAAWAMMNDLLTTEKARRMAKLQVQRVLEEQPEEVKPSAIEKYRRLG